VEEQQNLDVQPEVDLPAGTLASLSMGLFFSTGLILAAGLGAILGHHLLHDAFGLEHDILLGAIVGAILGAVVAVESVRGAAAWLTEHAGS
jgi:uncharacterized membrane protein YeaQ/YmgE (transglycosylase-associated protein family)